MESELRQQYPGVDVHGRTFDAADEASVEKVVNEAVNSYGRLDIFFANAGIVGMNLKLEDVKPEQFMEVLRINTLR